MARAPISKRIRFEVFKRDGFTCQYCGVKPPDVVLELDHIDAVAAGGSNEQSNLTTSCEPCNRGKSDRKLGDFTPRPDGDLLYLETQQEIVETKRYQKALAARRRAQKALARRLMKLWLEITDAEWCPKERIICQWLDRYEPEVVERAIRAAAPRVADGDINEWWRYMWAVLRQVRDSAS